VNPEMTNDTYRATEPEPYNELPPPIDPRDEAYSEAMEEIDRLKKIIEHLSLSEASRPAPAPQTRLVIASAPRATLVKLPPPRAQLVRLPQPRTDLVEITSAHIDETHVMTMPYGMIVRATLRGFLGSEAQLPRGGHIGDMWIVGDVPWVWITVPGTSAPIWIDP